MEKDTTALTTSSPHAAPAQAALASLSAFARVLFEAAEELPEALDPSLPPANRMAHQKIRKAAANLHIQTLKLVQQLQTTAAQSAPRS